MREKDKGKHQSKLNSKHRVAVVASTLAILAISLVAYLLNVEALDSIVKLLLSVIGGTSVAIATMPLILTIKAWKEEESRAWRSDNLRSVLTTVKCLAVLFSVIIYKTGIHVPVLIVSIIHFLVGERSLRAIHHMLMLIRPYEILVEALNQRRSLTEVVACYDGNKTPVCVINKPSLNAFGNVTQYTPHTHKLYSPLKKLYVYGDADGAPHNEITEGVLIERCFITEIEPEKGTAVLVEVTYHLVEDKKGNPVRTAFSLIGIPELLTGDYISDTDKDKLRDKCQGYEWYSQYTGTLELGESFSLFGDSDSLDYSIKTSEGILLEMHGSSYYTDDGKAVYDFRGLTGLTAQVRGNLINLPNIKIVIEGAEYVEPYLLKAIESGSIANYLDREIFLRIGENLVGMTDENLYKIWYHGNGVNETRRVHQGTEIKI